MRLNDRLRAEYQMLWNMCDVRPERRGLLETFVRRVQLGRTCYEMVEARTNVPWEVVGVIHMLEKSGRFDGHFHNGDPLTARTVRHPAGRPKGGRPPFTWTESAEDALLNCPPHLGKWKDWSLNGTLWRLECWNGLGYRMYHPFVLSPYLWAGSYHYSKGKYVEVREPETGKWRSEWMEDHVSKQIGAAVILKNLPEARWHQ